MKNKKIVHTHKAQIFLIKNVLECDENHVFEKETDLSPLKWSRLL